VEKKAVLLFDRNFSPPPASSQLSALAACLPRQRS